MQLNLTCSLIYLGNAGVSSFDLGSNYSVAGFVHAARVPNVVEGRLEGKHLRWPALREYDRSENKDGCNACRWTNKIGLILVWGEVSSSFKVSISCRRGSDSHLNMELQRALLLFNLVPTIVIVSFFQ